MMPGLGGFRNLGLILKLKGHENVVTNDVMYKMKTWKQKFLVMVNIYLFLQYSDTGVKAT